MKIVLHLVTRRTLHNLGKDEGHSLHNHGKDGGWFTHVIQIVLEIIHTKELNNEIYLFSSDNDGFIH